MIEDDDDDDDDNDDIPDNDVHVIDHVIDHVIFSWCGALWESVIFACYFVVLIWCFR